MAQSNEFSNVTKVFENNDNGEQFQGNWSNCTQNRYNPGNDSDKTTITDNTRIRMETLEPGTPFNTKLFVDELREISERQNRMRHINSHTISGYSIGGECIMAVVKKILGYPVESYAHNWLPISFRAALGTAVHDFLQENTNQFTEQERSLKVPSIKFSGRLDGLISYDILVEIKSCTYSDYSKILKTQQPRHSDFYQCMTYKWILENYLEEVQACKIKTRTPVPSLDKYQISKLQFIYVCHELFSADVETISEAIHIAKEVKKLLNSRRNQFFFIQSLIVDTNSFDNEPFITFIDEKINAINYFVDNNKLPPADNQFVDRSKCYFCTYNNNCEIQHI